MSIISTSFDITSSDNMWLIPSFDELTDAFGAEQVGILDDIEEVNPPSSVERNETFQLSFTPESPLKRTEEEEIVQIPSVKTEEEERLRREENTRATTTITTTTTAAANTSSNIFPDFNFQPNNDNDNDNMVINQTNFSFSIPLPKLETTPADIFDEGSFGPHKKIKLGETGYTSSYLSPSVCLSRKELLEFSSEEHELLIKKIRNSRQLTEEEEIIYREQRRLIKNREAASNSRAKKKTQIETLSEEVAKLKEDRETLEKEIERRTVENLWIKNEVQYLFTLVQQSKSLSAAFELFQKKPMETSSEPTLSRKRKHAEDNQTEGFSSCSSSEVPIEIKRERLVVPHLNSRTLELGTPA